ncbi:hypothetical protein NC653_041883 [Populus alba x Populus x berolinensis]|uniref:Uncharacterized protein n=1 Tax=Populus alba x Populus x berolinensis TaxID=444605 RepID=A0AAD6PRC2_9ROSI|nr:hypothetical protein NC653_041883 [Populus alba x Populus x berolinensis]
MNIYPFFFLNRPIMSRSLLAFRN